MLPDETLRWILAALAAFRLAWAFVAEDGPADLFLRWRTRMGVYDYGEERNPDGTPKPDSECGRWWSCAYCVSLFPIAPVVVLTAAAGLWPFDLLLAWFGLAGAVALMIRWRPWREV